MAGWDRLSPREEEVLAAVGRRLTNGEIAERFHLSVRTVESHIAALRRKLGVDSRSALVDAAAGRSPAVVARPDNSFVGRDRDLAALDDLLERSRCVTVVGPAGAGKTRLALELAARSSAAPVVVDLAGAADEDVPRLVATAVGVGSDSGERLLASAAVVLAGRDWLLVLDNCDRVVPGVREVVRRLLPQARSVRVLSTSRVPLGATDESVYTLPPLTVGAVDGASAAVQLFRDRAATAAPQVALAAADDEVIASLCARLDGLPLAIELAAARLRHLPVAELARRLSEGFEALERTGSDDRHRTLETAIAWSWDLLDAQEAAVLSRLAVLPRAFDLETVEAVLGAGSAQVAMRLLEKSLLAPAGSSDGLLRFRLLESLRAFALERTSPDLVTAVRLRHAEHFAERATFLAAKARIDDSLGTKAMAEHACADINAALVWSLRQDRRDLVLALTHALAIGVEQYRPDVDSVAALTEAARRPWLRATAPVRDLLDLGVALSLGDLRLVHELADAATARAADGESRAAAESLMAYALAYADRGDEALEHADAAQALAREHGDTWLLAAAQQARGTALGAASSPAPAAALEAYESAMQSYALAGDAMHVNVCRYLMASTAAEAGVRTEQARVWAEQCVAYTEATGDAHERAHAVLTRNQLVDVPSVEELEQVAEAFRSCGDLHCLTRTYLRLADVVRGADQVGALRQAAAVARAARHPGRESDALERLVRLHWAAADRHAAAVALGELSVVLGDAQAVARSPEELRSGLDEWVAAIAEGRARALAAVAGADR